MSIAGGLVRSWGGTEGDGEQAGREGGGSDHGGGGEGAESFSLSPLSPPLSFGAGNRSVHPRAAFGAAAAAADRRGSCASDPRCVPDADDNGDCQLRAERTCWDGFELEGDNDQLGMAVSLGAEDSGESRECRLDAE